MGLFDGQFQVWCVLCAVRVKFLPDVLVLLKFEVGRHGSSGHSGIRCGLCVRQFRVVLEVSLWVKFRSFGGFCAD